MSCAPHGRPAQLLRGARDTLGLCLCVACVRIRSCRSTAANFRTSHAARSAQQIKTSPCGAQLKEDIESEEDAREICGFQLERIIVIIIVLVCVDPEGDIVVADLLSPLKGQFKWQTRHLINSRADCAAATQANGTLCASLPLSFPLESVCACAWGILVVLGMPYALCNIPKIPSENIVIN